MLGAVASIRIDDASWDAAPALRRDDWRVTLAGLIDSGGFGQSGDHTLLVSLVPMRAITFSTFDEHGAPRCTFEAPLGDLKKHIDEYLAIIARMHGGDRAEVSSRMHAFDMAKKVVHDQGARALKAALPGLAQDHETYRRLFTLVVSLVVDVTRLPGATSKHF